jgi:hypothetical protein
MLTRRDAPGPRGPATDRSDQASQTGGRRAQAWRVAGAAGTFGATAGAYGQSIVEKLLPGAPLWLYVAGAAAFGVPALWEKAKALREKARRRNEDRPQS